MEDRLKRMKLAKKRAVKVKQTPLPGTTSLLATQTVVIVAMPFHLRVQTLKVKTYGARTGQHMYL